MRTPHLHAEYPALRESLPWVALGQGPTPVRSLDPLRAGNGAELWVKDESGFGDGGWGGNKVRKLEWILPDAKRRGRRTILTIGALGTNHGLATALYAHDRGLRTAIALVDQPLDDHVRAAFARLEASPATLHRTHTKLRTMLATPWLLLRHGSGGRPAYFLPPGGSSAVGALGYVEAAFEIAAQVRSGELPREPSAVVVALGSGGSGAGLMLGLRLAGLRSRVVGIVVADGLPLDAKTISGLARRSAALLRRRGAAIPEDALAIAAPDITIVTDQMGAGYGHPTDAGAAALEAARQVGLTLEPVYTAKALAGAMSATTPLDDGLVLFVNTHGPR